MRTNFFIFTLLFVAGSVTAQPGINAAPRYNVLFLISDDMRAELTCYGGMARTPNLDRLAATGVRFDRAYA